MNLPVLKPAWKGGFFLVCIGLVGALVAALWLLFQPALPGIVHFDDIGNLSGLPTIVDLESAERWVQNGLAGPFGRPIALATFALQYYEWPNPRAFLQWNIALHIINALLVMWLTVLLARRAGHSAIRQAIFGFLVAFTWAALPLLNSSVLFIVQRMALLASTFVLMGLVAYLKCRDTLRASYLRQFAALVVLGGFGVLALFTKESGALIVAYALVLELGLLLIARQRRLTFVAIVLLLANVLLLAGLAPKAFWHICAEMTRGFDVYQRLGSQGFVLPAYLKGLLLPSQADLNPFRFEFLLGDFPNLQWGIVVWVLLMTSPLVAWWCGWRVAALALGWFFLGHIMESGWLNLEPFFAHRNYLPAIALTFALVYGVLAIRQRAKLWRGAFVVYVLLLAGMTWMNTSLWGNRSLAAEIWSMGQPQSVRGILNLAYDVERTQGLEQAQSILDRFVVEERDSVGLRLQGLVSACVLDPESDHSEKLRALENAIATLPYEGWAPDVVEKLLETVRKQECKGVSSNAVAEIAAAFLNQPAYQCNRATTHNMLWILGLVAMDHGDLRTAMGFYMKGLKEAPTYSMANYYLDLASQTGDRAGIKELSGLLLKAPVPRGSTKAEWEDLRSRVEQQLNAPVPSDTQESDTAATRVNQHP